MDLQTALTNIKARFQSMNGVPIDKASVPAVEIEALLLALDKQVEGRPKPASSQPPMNDDPVLLEFRVWPDGFVQPTDEVAPEWRSDDFQVVMAYDEEDALRRSL